MSVHPVIRDIFTDHPHIHTVVWDGEVKVNGSFTGDPLVFEVLWDLFVDTPHITYVRSSDMFSITEDG